MPQFLQARERRTAGEHMTLARSREATIVGLLLLGAAVPFPTAGRDLARSIAASQDTVREFTVTARKYAFNPSRIEAGRGDILKITFVAEDAPHTFTIDEYRIAKRAAPGQSVTFEFCAHRSGRFVFYSSLTEDQGRPDMRGELIVK
jgi:plastocyanin